MLLYVRPLRGALVQIEHVKKTRVIKLVVHLVDAARAILNVLCCFFVLSLNYACNQVCIGTAHTYTCNKHARKWGAMLLLMMVSLCFCTGRYSECREVPVFTGFRKNSQNLQMMPKNVKI